ncbi:unnamed protein product [Acanthoscelides obtectus]|uniref:Uncharacterized protein n=1 Tax=Acanthoscelides obtectus TaxID=200917 RepID=A0A9P0PYI6_ACAOB|nr:unnamed protein product [Acanthoscelides obtectus]CAK1623578.1 hypothetical protein AOBTE_LOCUS2082 [Acanthoscelides obtectus]
MISVFHTVSPSRIRLQPNLRSNSIEQREIFFHKISKIW